MEERRVPGNGQIGDEVFVRGQLRNLIAWDTFEIQDHIIIYSGQRRQGFHILDNIKRQTSRLQLSICRLCRFLHILRFFVGLVHSIPSEST